MKKYRFFIITMLLTFGISGFFYLANKNLISNYNVIGTIYDNQIPLIKEFIYFYAIWYPFQIYIFYLIYKEDIKIYIRGIIALFLSLMTAHICFFIFPSEIVRPTLNSYNNLTEFILYITYKSDTPVNCFPSIHCIICFITIFATISNKKMNWKYRYMIYFVNIMIILSTLFVKQHVLIDPLGAFIITMICYYFISDLKILSKFKTRLEKLI